jgi:hypothetical protein
MTAANHNNIGLIQGRKSRNRFARRVALAAMPLAAVAVTNPAHATVITLNSANTDAVISTKVNGLESWVVDGVQMLNEPSDPTETAFQSFYYSVGNGGPSAITALKQVSATHTTSSNPNGPDTLDVKYDSIYGPSATYDLVTKLYGGAPSAGAHINETLTVTNTSSQDLCLHLYEYNDFNIVNCDPALNSLSITGGNTAHETFGKLPNAITETVGPMPSEFDVVPCDNYLWELDAQPQLTLGDHAGPLNNDASFGFEWDDTLAPGAQLVLTKQISESAGIGASIPEPSGSSIAMLGGTLLLARRRRRPAL